MANLLITFADGGFPSTSFSGTLQDLIDLFVANLDATVEEDNLIFGKIGGTAPVTNIGPWLDGLTWKVYSAGTYIPAQIRVGDATHVVTLAGVPTANRTQNLQDKTGTIALTSDVFDPRNSINLATTSPAHQIDWSTSFSFFETISAGQTYTMINSLPGQKIIVKITTTGAFVPTWPTIVLWPGGTAPGQTNTGTDIYRFYNAGGTIYGEQIGQNYS